MGRSELATSRRSGQFRQGRAKKQHQGHDHAPSVRAYIAQQPSHQAPVVGLPQNFVVFKTTRHVQPQSLSLGNFLAQFLLQKLALVHRRVAPINLDQI